MSLLFYNIVKCECYQIKLFFSRIKYRGNAQLAVVVTQIITIFVRSFYHRTVLVNELPNIGIHTVSDVN